MSNLKIKDPTSDVYKLIHSSIHSFRQENKDSIAKKYIADRLIRNNERPNRRLEIIYGNGVRKLDGAYLSPEEFIGYLGLGLSAGQVGDIQYFQPEADSIFVPHKSHSRISPPAIKCDCVINIHASLIPTHSEVPPSKPGSDADANPTINGHPVGDFSTDIDAADPPTFIDVALECKKIPDHAAAAGGGVGVGGAGVGARLIPKLKYTCANISGFSFLLSDTGAEILHKFFRHIPFINALTAGSKSRSKRSPMAAASPAASAASPAASAASPAAANRKLNDVNIMTLISQLNTDQSVFRERNQESLRESMALYENLLDQRDRHRDRHRDKKRRAKGSAASAADDTDDADDVFDESKKLMLRKLFEWYIKDAWYIDKQVVSMPAQFPLPGEHYEARFFSISSRDSFNDSKIKKKYAGNPQVIKAINDVTFGFFMKFSVTDGAGHTYNFNVRLERADLFRPHSDMPERYFFMDDIVDMFTDTVLARVLSLHIRKLFFDRFDAYFGQPERRNDTAIWGESKHYFQTDAIWFHLFNNCEFTLVNMGCSVIQMIKIPNNIKYLKLYGYRKLQRWEYSDSDGVGSDINGGGNGGSGAVKPARSRFTYVFKYLSAFPVDFAKHGYHMLLQYPFLSRFIRKHVLHSYRNDESKVAYRLTIQDGCGGVASPIHTIPDEVTAYQRTHSDSVKTIHTDSIRRDHIGKIKPRKDLSSDSDSHSDNSRSHSGIIASHNSSQSLGNLSDASDRTFSAIASSALDDSLSASASARPSFFDPLKRPSPSPTPAKPRILRARRPSAAPAAQSRSQTRASKQQKQKRGGVRTRKFGRRTRKSKIN